MDTSRLSLLSLLVEIKLSDPYLLRYTNQTPGEVLIVLKSGPCWAMHWPPSGKWKVNS